jgi:hypothetical protein
VAGPTNPAGPRNTHGLETLIALSQGTRTLVETATRARKSLTAYWLNAIRKMVAPFTVDDSQV